MTTRIPFLSQGLGPIGSRILLAACGDPGFEAVGAVDVAPALAGRALSDVIPGAPEGLVVSATLDEALAAAPRRPALVLDATGSWLVDVAPRLEAVLARGLSVVSTCEELSWPYHRHPALAASLDAVARAAGVTLVGTGVNPGFLMDQLPVTLTAASHAIRSLTVSRVQDPTQRRIPFQAKVGMGLSRAAWEAEATTGRFGHVGLEESGRLLAAGLGWTIPKWTVTLEPVQPDQAGPVLGTLQVLTGATDDGRHLKLHFEAQSGVAESFDEVVVEGTPPLRLRFVGGVGGDDATSAAVLRAARVIASTRRGLATVLDLPLRAFPAP